MKKLYLTIVPLCIFCLSSNAQEKKLQINFGADTGFSKVEFNEQSIDVSTSGASLHLQYGVSKYFSLESGVDFIKTQGDFTSSGNSYFIENQYLSIPLGLRTKIGLGKDGESISDQKFTLLIGAGLYTNYLMKSKVENIGSEKSVGWNFGSYGNFGVHIQANSIFSLGAGLKMQRDFSDILKDNTLSVKQNRNVVYLDFGVRL